ncbi:MAG TPA: MAPEG family protein, partial [Rhizomicrobium sp.]|nr:MAPEG family protein [Rhizomicrobium sp.]
LSTVLLVARVRGQTGIMPPATTGAPELERALRTQANTVEQFVVFVPALWLAALYFQGWIPPLLGLVWCLGRLLYISAYSAGRSRHLSFGLTIYPTLILAVLAGIGLVKAWLVNG